MGDGAVKYKIFGDNSEWERSVRQSETIAEDAADKIQKTFAVAAAAIGVAAVAALKQVIEVGTATEYSVAKLETIADTSSKSITALSADISKLAKTTGVSAADLANSTYDAISATGDTANAVSLVGDATKLAKAGFTSTASSLSVLTTVMNAYHKSAEEAAYISDTMIATQNLGVTTVGKLAASMGKAIASASAYGVGLENLETGYIALTKSGISTEESTTYLVSMLKELGDAGTKVGSIIVDKTGKSFGTLMNEGYSLADVLKIVYESTGNNAEALMNLWSSAEAGKASNAIVSQGLEEFNGWLDQVKNSAGSTQKAYAIMESTIEEKNNKLKSSLQVLGDTIFEKFIKNPLGKVLDSATKSTEELTDNVDVLVPAVLAAVAAVGAFAIAINMVKIIDAVRNAFIALNVAMSANPVMLVASLFAAATAALITYVATIPEAETEESKLNKEMEETASKLAEIDENLKSVTDEYNNSVSSTKNAADAAQTYVERLAELEKTTNKSSKEQAEWNGLLTKIKALIPDTSELIDDNTKSIKGGTKALSGYIANWKKAQIAAATASAAQGAATELVEAMVNLDKATSAYEQVLSDVSTAQKNFASVLKEAQDQYGSNVTDTQSLMDAMTESGRTYEEMQYDLVNSSTSLLARFKPLSDELQYQQDRIDGASDAVANNKAKVEECNAELDKYSVYAGAATESTEDYTESMDDNSAAIQKSADTVTGWAKDVQDATDVYKKSLGEWADEAQNVLEKINDKEEYTTDQLIENISSNATRMRQWLIDLGELSKKGLDEGLIQSIRDAGPEYSESVHNLVTASETEIKKINKIYSSASKEALDALEKSIYAAVPDVKDAGKAVGDAVGKGIKDTIKASVKSIPELLKDSLTAAFQGKMNTTLSLAGVESSAAPDAGSYSVFNNNMNAVNANIKLDVDGSTLTNIVLRNLDDSAAFTIRGN